jgi:hypothetical protein
MPYKNREEKLEAMRRWRKDKMAKGYGKWLYERRKLRFEDAERFRDAMDRAIDELRSSKTSVATRANNAIDILTDALRESMEAEEKLGRFAEEEEK